MKQGLESVNVRLVIVEWEDSRQPNESWERLSEMESDGICKCVSVGFLVHNGTDHIILAPNVADFDNDNFQVSGAIHIPKSCVTSMTTLEEVDPIGQKLFWDSRD